MATTIQDIEKQIAKIKQDIAVIGDMRPGSLSKQKRARGTQYHQLSYRHDGKGHTEYVRKESLPVVRRQLVAYRRYLELNRRWTTLAIELCKLKAAQEKGGKAGKGRDCSQQGETCAEEI